MDAKQAAGAGINPAADFEVVLARGEARWTALCIVVYSCIQFAFLIFVCDWDLSGDEAEYWAWSRRLDWSYFAKGPVIALVLRLGTMLAGPASLALTGSLMPAVRLPIVALSALTAWGVYRLGAEVCRNPRAGLIGVLLLPAIPLFRVGGLLATIDTPLVCCWTWSAVWSYRALRDAPNAWAWVFAGLLCAVGVAAKYTMLAFPASVGLYLLIDSRRRGELLRPGFWMLALGCALGMAPVIYWNIHHQWVAASQMSDRLGFNTSWNWGRVQPFFSFLAGDLAALGIWWVVGARVLMKSVIEIRENRRDAASPDLMYLLALWVVVWSACVAVSLLGETEANWSAPAHVSLVVLIGWWLSRRPFAQGFKSRAWRPYIIIWTLCMTALTGFQHAAWFYPIAARLNLTPAPSAAIPVPLRIYEPSSRLLGYRDLAPEVTRHMEALRVEGLNPFVLAPTYTLASTLTFHLPGQPEVYCLGWSPGFAAIALNQHDLWRPNPRHDLQVFRDRPAVVVEDAAPPPGYAHGLADQGMFRQAEASERLIARRGGVVVGAWDITVCRGYLGLGDAAEMREIFRMYASSEYFKRQGGTARSYIQGLYRDILGRPSSAEDESFWIGVLTAQPRELVVAQIAGSRKAKRGNGR